MRIFSQERGQRATISRGSLLGCPFDRWLNPKTNYRGAIYLSRLAPISSLHWPPGSRILPGGHWTSNDVKH
jgi:hypothetical protein